MSLSSIGARPACEPWVIRIPHGGGFAWTTRPRAVASASSASRREETSSLRSRLFTCERTVCSEMNSRSAISSVPRCSSSRSSTSSSRALSDGAIVVGDAAAGAAFAHLLEQAPRDLARERRLALGRRRAGTRRSARAARSSAGSRPRRRGSRRAGSPRCPRRSARRPRVSGAASRMRGKRRQAVHPRHREVEQDEVRLQPPRQLDRLLAVGRLAGDREAVRPRAAPTARRA